MIAGFEALAAAARRVRAPGGGCVRAFSLHAQTVRRLALGTKDGETGGPHAPLALSESLGAAYRLVWDDGRLSRGSLDRIQFLEDPEGALAKASEAAYDDPDATRVLGPAAFPDVAIFDPAAARAAAGDTAPLADRLARVRACFARGGFRTWSGSFSAAESEARVATSAGLDVSGHGTGAAWHVTFDGEWGVGFSGRALDDDAAFEARLAGLADYADRLRRPGAALAPGARRVVLHPDVVDALVVATLLHNLEGGSVAHGEGAFRREQFGSGEPVLGERLTLRLDPLRPMRIGSYRFTSEGLPAARCTFVERGRLVTPVLDLKYAARLAMAPTPLPYHQDAIVLEGPPVVTADAAFAEAGEGALVLNVLGVHTQDPASGDFSLAVPQALRVLRGALDGKIAGTISGNVFDLLRDPSAKLVTFPGEPAPGLLATCRLDPRRPAGSP